MPDADAPLSASTHKSAGAKEETGNNNGSSGWTTAAVQFAFSSGSGATVDPTEHLSALRDNHSSYTSVAKSCFVVTQFAAHGSPLSGEEAVGLSQSSGILSNTLVHPHQYVKMCSPSIEALLECVGSHDDRRARCAAATALATLARATYARLRFSPHLWAHHEKSFSRLEDECGSEVPLALCNVALDDADEGVAAVALAALGNMVQTTTTMAGEMHVQDFLLRHVLGMQGLISTMTTRNAGSIDEDPTIAQMELQGRIYDNILIPRLLQLCHRVQEWIDPRDRWSVLPVLTAALVYMQRTVGTLKFDMDRTLYAKRWVELDADQLTTDWASLLQFEMTLSASSGMGATAAICALKLAHACRHAAWRTPLCQTICQTLQQEYSIVGSSKEAQFNYLSHLLVAARAIPVDDPFRLSVLNFVVQRLVQDIPSTRPSPHGLCSLGLLLGSSYRTPARSGFWAEVALSLLQDGPTLSSSVGRTRTLQGFLKQSVVQKLLSESASGVLSPREEMVYSFCATAAESGRALRSCPLGSSSLTSFNKKEEWVKCSIILMEAFQECLSWSASTPAPSYLEDDCGMLSATQAAYMTLLQETLFAVGLLNPSSSISLKTAQQSSPPSLFWDQLCELEVWHSQNSATIQEVPSPAPASLLDPISRLVFDMIKRENKGSGVGSHHLRFYLLTLATDQWVHGRSIESRAAGLNFDHAKELLSALSPRRVFAKVVDPHRWQIETYPKKRKDLYKKYAQETVTACVACIESIALMANEWKSKFGSISEIKQIASLAMAALQCEDSSGQAVLPVCQEAIERIQQTFAGSGQTNGVSPLIPRGSDGQSRPRPFITTSRIQEEEGVYGRGYLVLAARSITLARIDLCLLSTPMMPTDGTAVRKENWLRLAVPPLPQERESKDIGAIQAIPRFAWEANSASLSGGSDPFIALLAHSIRRNPRYDGLDEFVLAVTVKVVNITPLNLEHGLQVGLGVSQEHPGTSFAEDDVSSSILKSLGGVEALPFQDLSLSAVATYKHEIKSGEYLNWEITLRAVPLTGRLALFPTVVYREIEKESDDTIAWASVGEEQKDPASEGKKREQTSGSVEKENVAFPLEAQKLSHMVGLQPCPFVFFRGGGGDIHSFRFLWSRMENQIPPLQLRLSQNNSEKEARHFGTIRLAVLSSLRFDGEAIPGGAITKVWAFMALHGERLLCVLAESSQGAATLHIRSDDKQLIWCVAGTVCARQDLLAALVPGAVEA